MKTLKFVTIAFVLAGAAAIIALYLVAVSVGKTGQAINNYYSACEPIYCQPLPTATSTAIAEE